MKNHTIMNENLNIKKELKIEVPQGYEIDKEKSTFEKIVFKKIPENPKTWEEYCKLTKGSCSNYATTTNMVYKDKHTGTYNEFTTKERAEQFIALGKLLQLRDYWVGGWEPDLPITPVFAVKNNKIINLIRITIPLTFPTKEMAEEFKDCFEDLIKEAYPLV